MKITKTLHVTTRIAWRTWLKKHYRTTSEIWLVAYRKETGKPRLSYNDTVEEALCFGWIDSTVKKLDKARFVQRFTPRNPKTPYSQTNKERLKVLLKKGKVMKSVRDTLDNVTKEKFRLPPDILKVIQSNTLAWKNFQTFSDRYKRIRIGFIDGARKRPAEFKKRLRYFVQMTAKNKQFGFGGVEKYF